MELFLVRHAWAGEYGDPRFPNDCLRPLTEEGKQRFAEMAELLVARGFGPQIIATSPLTRCRQTADILAAHVRPEPAVRELEALEPGSDLKSLLAWSNKQANQQSAMQIAWVGHNPDLPAMTAELIGDGSAEARFAKGAVAAIRFNGEIECGAGELRWLATAKLLGC